MEVTYNCWHGCHKKSEGCKNCYVFARDNSIDKDASKIYKTKAFDMPIKKNRKGEYKYPSGTEFMMCFSSDFFVEEGDAWRLDILDMIKLRKDCTFFCITKRPERIMKCIPNVEEYSNLYIFCTMENQKRFDERAPIYLNLPLHTKGVIIEPMLERVDVSKYLDKIDMITVGGESGMNSRVCDFNWIKEIHDICKKAQIEFYFHQTGAKLIVDNKLYAIPRSKQHSQARIAFKD